MKLKKKKKSRKVELIGDIWLCFDMIFSVPHFYYKAVGVASYTIHVN